MIAQLRFEKRMVSHVPWGLLAASVLLALIGIFNLASATRAQGSALWVNQSLYLVVALLSCAGVALIDYRVIQRMAVPIYLVNVGLLILLKFIGHKAKGAESWFVLGPVRVQPAEFMKIAMIVMLARIFHDEQTQKPLPPFVHEVVMALVCLLPIYLVLKQPDLGTAMMMSLTAGTLILFARARWWLLAAVALVVLAGVGVLWNDWVREQPDGQRFTLVRHHMKKHQDDRIAGWLNPEADPKGTNYHAIQSKIAVGSGGITGKGWKKGTQTQNLFLPEMHTDFVFSVWAEEHGFLKCLLLLFLYGVILVSALGVAFHARDRFGALLAVGVAAMVFWQVLENIGMVTGLLPITGITLPLMSYGGSSLVSVLMSIGLLVNVSMRRHIF